MKIKLTFALGALGVMALAQKLGNAARALGTITKPVDLGALLP